MEETDYNGFNDFDDFNFITKLLDDDTKINDSPLEIIDDERNKNAQEGEVSDEIIIKLRENNVNSYYYMYNRKSINKEFYDALRCNNSLNTLFLCINMELDLNPLSDIFKSYLTNIQILNLSRNLIQNADNLFEGLKNNVSLTYLNLSSNQLSNVSSMCDYLIDNKNLKILDISYNNITNIDEFENVLTHNKCLEELNIGHNDICDIEEGGGIIKFCDGLKNNNTLRVLYMEQIKLTNINPLFESLLHNTALAVLNLYMNDETNLNVDYLEKFFIENKGLNKLSLRRTGIKDIQKLCNGLIHNTTLAYLDLQVNELNEEQLHYLEKVMQENIILETVLVNKI